MSIGLLRADSIRSMVLPVLATMLASGAARADHLPGVDPIVAGGDYGHTDHSFHDHSGKSLAGIQLDDANLTGTDFSGADLAGANLSRSNLSGANLSNATLPNASMRDATVTGASFSGADLFSVSLRDSIGLTDTQLRSALSVVDTDLGGVDLSGADLSGLDFTAASFFPSGQLVGANLTGAIFVDASVANTDVTGATLTGADFTGASLYGNMGALTAAQLRSAASVRNVLLGDRDFSGQDLSGVDLTNATFSDATLLGTDLSGTTGLQLAIFCDLTWYKDETQFPPGFDPIANGLTHYGSSELYADFTTIVESGDLIPIVGYPFDPTYYPLRNSGLDMNDAGQVVFKHTANSLNLSTGVYTGSGGPLTVTASFAWPNNSPAPGSDGVLSGQWTGSFESPAINNSGDIAFDTMISSDPLRDWGVFKYANGSESAIALEGDPMPVPGGATYERFTFGGRLDMNDSGDVVFLAEIAPTSGVGEIGVFLDQNGVKSAVFLESQIAPGTGSGTYAPDGRYSFPRISASGDVVALMNVANGSTTKGIFRSSASVHSAIALVGDPAPDSGGGTFSDFPGSSLSPNPRVNAAGDVVFLAEVIDGSIDRGLFVNSAGTTRLVAAPGQPAPGTGTVFSSVGNGYINDSGDILFGARFNGSSGLFLDADGTHIPVLLIGEPVPDGSGRYFSQFWSRAFNNSGDIALITLMSDGTNLSEAIYVLPEPGTPTLLGWGVVMLANLARRSPRRARAA